MIAECCENLFLYNSKTEISMNNNMTFIAFQFFPTKGSAGSAKSQYNSPKWKAAGDSYKCSFSSRVSQSSWWPWIPGTPLRSPVWHPHVLPGAGAQCCLADKTTITPIVLQDMGFLGNSKFLLQAREVWWDVAWGGAAGSECLCYWMY